MFLFCARLYCDRCRAQFRAVAMDTADDPSSCDELAVALELQAQESGWVRYKDGLTCDACLIDMAYERELARQNAS